MVNQKLKDQFITLCRSEIQRNGIEELLLYLEQTDFYTAPASTRFHGNYSGGLVEHSLNVYKATKQLANQHQELNISAESIAIAALFHDLCKANLYVLSTKNVKDDTTGIWRKEPFYKTDDKYPLGHQEAAGSEPRLLREGPYSTVSDGVFPAPRYNRFNTALENKLASLGLKVKTRPIEIGYDVRCQTPVSYDLMYCSELAVGVWVLFKRGETGCMVFADHNGKIHPLYLKDLQDPKTGKIMPRLVDISNEKFHNVMHNILHAVTPADYEAARKFVANPEEYDFYKILNWEPQE